MWGSLQSRTMVSSLVTGACGGPGKGTVSAWAGINDYVRYGFTNGNLEEVFCPPRESAGKANVTSGCHYELEKS